MTQIISRRLFLAGLMSGAASAALAKAPQTSLRPVARPEGGAAQAAKPRVAGADALIEKAKLGGVVGFSVIDVKSGLVLEEHDATSGQPPASVTKTVTALYALDRLGAGHRFETRLIADGPVQGGVLRGDLILAGGGDPTLDTDMLASLAAKLKAAGIREVKGDLRPWGGALPQVAMLDKAEAEHVAYNPSISGLNLNYNRVHFEWKRAGKDYAVTMDARSAKYRPDVKIARMAVAARTLPVYTYADKGAYDDWTVARGQLGKGGARWLPVRKPEAYCAEVFAIFARAQGIVLRQGAPLTALPKGGVVLASLQSAPLTEILRDMLKYSNNMTAEAVGLAATASRLGPGGTLARSAQEMSAWANSALGMNGARFVDHSGLGDASRVSASSMARAMATAHRSGALKPLLKSFSMRDGDDNGNDGHPIKVVAKTGTLYFVSSLTGYMTAPDGTELAFAILAANDAKRDGFDRKSGTRPEGAASWNTRAKRLQQDLIERWGAVYGS